MSEDQNRSAIGVHGLGQCCIDYPAPIESYPPADSNCELSTMVVQGGGPVATALVALAEGKEIEQPAYSVAAVDTTACGDIFYAGYTWGLLQGWSVEKRLDFGAWPAS